MRAATPALRAASLSLPTLLALLVAPAVTANLLQYKTESVKGAACGVENKPLGPFYIPDDQCTGVLYELARHCERLELVKVEVTDYAHARVHIEDSLGSASVERTPSAAAGGRCPGRAVVRAVLGCGARYSDESASRGAASSDAAASALPPL